MADAARADGGRRAARTKERSVGSDAGLYGGWEIVWTGLRPGTVEPMPIEVPGLAAVK